MGHSPSSIISNNIYSSEDTDTGKRRKPKIKKEDPSKHVVDSINDNIIRPAYRGILELGSNALKGSANIAGTMDYDIAKYYLDKYGHNLSQQAKLIPKTSGITASISEQVPEIAAGILFSKPTILLSALSTYGDVVSNRGDEGFSREGALSAALNAFLGSTEIKALKGTRKNIRIGTKAKIRRDTHWDDKGKGKHSKMAIQLSPDPETNKLTPASVSSLTKRRNKEFLSALGKTTAKAAKFGVANRADSEQKEFLSNYNRGSK